MARISVVIPAYNAARFLERTVASVLSQTVTDLEVVIVDDGSSDDTFAIARALCVKDDRVRAFTKPNGGVASARNYGVACSNATSEFVAFIDADDLYEPDALETLSSALGANPAAVAAHGLARFIDESDRRIREGQAEDWGRNRRRVEGWRSTESSPEAPTTLAVLAHWNSIHTPGQVLIRRSALAAVGESDPALKIAQDYDLWLRLACRGDFVFVNRALLNYRVLSTGLSSNASKRYDEDWRVRRALLGAPGLTREQRRDCAVAILQAPLALRLGYVRSALAEGRLGQALSNVKPLLGAYARIALALPALVKPSALR
ncbi:MAG TPA: glycosyltransferase [Polyangiaceae bacterium]